MHCISSRMGLGMVRCVHCGSIITVMVIIGSSTSVQSVQSAGMQSMIITIIEVDDTKSRFHEAKSAYTKVHTQNARVSQNVQL